MSGYSMNYATETVGLRGYENGSLTPHATREHPEHNGGYAYNRLTLELRYPFMLGNTTIYGLGFVEGGNAWYHVKDFSPFNINAFCWCWRSHLLTYGRIDGYRLCLRI